MIGALRWRLAVSPRPRYRRGVLWSLLCLVLDHRIAQEHQTLWGEIWCLQPHCSRCGVHFTDEDVGLPEWR